MEYNSAHTHGVDNFINDLNPVETFGIGIKHHKIWYYLE